jgi:hypothetical protein
METQVDQLNQKQRQRWMEQGIEITPFGIRIPTMKKSFSADLEVTVRDPETEEWRPYLLRSGRPLLCSEIIPDFADLALDEKGHLLDQLHFQENYKVFLEAFIYPSGSEAQNEPVPNVSRFVNRKPDEWGESKGMVEIDFDPKLGQEFVPQKLIDKDGNDAKLDEMQSVLMKLSEIAIGQNQIEGPEDEPTPAPVIGMPLQEVSAASEPEGHERTPCGTTWVKKGYVKQHQRHCNEEACGGPGVNTSGDEAA